MSVWIARNNIWESWKDPEAGTVDLYVDRLDRFFSLKLKFFLLGVDIL